VRLRLKIVQRPGFNLEFNVDSTVIIVEAVNVVPARRTGNSTRMTTFSLILSFSIETDVFEGRHFARDQRSLCPPGAVLHGVGAT